jgi:Tfp pilus assembly pilus retraction ATPase PilT
MLPIVEQNLILASLASIFEDIILQRLVEAVDGGRTAAIEIPRKMARIEQLILGNRDYEILDALQRGAGCFLRKSSVFFSYNPTSLYRNVNVMW